VATLEGAGLRVEHTEFFRKRRGFESWLSRGDCDEATAAVVRARFASAAPAVVAALAIEHDEDGRTSAFTDDKIMLVARPR
jgi:hypothetical protein